MVLFIMTYLKLSTYLLLLTSCSSNSAESVDINSIHKDIANFNITCYQEKCDNYHEDSLLFWDCHCGIHCVHLGTCCLDSYYVSMPQPKLKPSCRSVYEGDNYFIVDKCSSDSAWASLCNEEWNGQDDIQQLVPVTSLMTSITYKNYYCLRCHETTDEFLYWIVKIESKNIDIEDESTLLDKHVFLTYNQDMATWMAMYDEDIGYIPVKISIIVPSEILEIAHNCQPHAISDCSEKWTDEEVKVKCQSYMSMKAVSKNSKQYKNIHCALCNFESLGDIQCRTLFFTILGGKRPFSFTYLLDINRSDGELVDKIQRCADDHTWDPYTKKCRKLTCAIPGYKIQNGKCVQ